MNISGQTASRQAEFKSLGVRHDRHYSETEKEKLFADAVDQMTNFVQQHADKPTSIPELVRRIFDDQTKAPELEDIRELLRPTHRFARHAISASGHKLLALLAIQQDEHCLDEQGKLRLEYTKSLMRGWFENGYDIEFDDSALQNIQRDASQPNNNQKFIKLGNNRLTGINLQITGTISDTIKNNYDKSQFGEQDMTLNFATRPQFTVKQSYNEIALGDMNGNSMMFLHQLVQSGLADIKPGQEQAWDTLIQSIKDNNVDGFRENLEKVLECKHTDKKLILLGDLLSDRTYNDWFTLSIIDFLHEKRQNFSICFSNHDAAFVDYYLINKNKHDDENYGTDEKSGIKISVRPADSLEAVNKTLNENKECRENFKKMTENYLSHLVILDQSLDQRQIYAHGVLTDNMLNDMLEIAGLSSEVISELGAKEKIQHANQYFQEFVLKDINTFHDLLDSEGEEITPKPFRATIWNIGPFPKNGIFADNKAHRYTETKPPNNLRVIHGHTEDIRESLETRASLHKKITSMSKKFDEKTNIKIDQNLIKELAIDVIDLIEFHCGSNIISACMSLLLWAHDRIDPQIQNKELAQDINSIKIKVVHYKNNFRNLNSQDNKNILNEIQALAGNILTNLTNKDYNDIFSSKKNFDEIFHSFSLQFDEQIKSFQKQKSPNSVPFNPLHFPLMAGLNGIWLTEHDKLAAKSYVSLDAGVGASKSDSGGNAKIFIA